MATVRVQEKPKAPELKEFKRSSTRQLLEKIASNPHRDERIAARKELAKISRKKHITSDAALSARSTLLVLVASAKRFLQVADNRSFYFQEAMLRGSTAKIYAKKIAAKLRAQEPSTTPILNPEFFDKIVQKTLSILRLSQSAINLLAPPSDPNDAFQQAKHMLDDSISHVEKIKNAEKMKLEFKSDDNVPQNAAIFALTLASQMASRIIALQTDHVNNLSKLLVNIMLPAALQLFMSKQKLALNNHGKQEQVLKDLSQFREQYRALRNSLEYQIRTRGVRGFDKMVQAIDQLDIQLKQLLPAKAKQPVVQEVLPNRVDSPRNSR